MMERFGLLFYFVFLQEIKKFRDEFIRQWNYYGFSIDGGLCFFQFWIEGILRFVNSRNLFLDGILLEEELIWYGVDEEDVIFVLEED